MGSCIICGSSVEGRICDSHEEDVAFDFRGDSPQQLGAGRFYRGTVDGYAEFGVFIDLAPGVTGLLHRSELDRRLESLDWEAGDTVYVQVKNVRDNGNVDLAWSIRQAERDFRGLLVQEDGTERLPDEEAEAEAAEADTTEAEAAEADTTEAEAAEADTTEAEAAEVNTAEAESAETANAAEVQPATAVSGAPEESEVVETSEAIEEAEVKKAEAEAREAEAAEAEPTDTTESVSGTDQNATQDAQEAEPEEDASAGADPENTETAAEPEEPTDEYEHVSVDSLADRVSDRIRLEGEVVSVRQTGGPTIFEVRDETGVVDCAAFVEPGVRAYEAVELGDMIRLDGEVELRHDEIQVETEALDILEGEEAETVGRRLAEALTAEARPDAIDPIGGDDAVVALEDGLLDAAEAVRRAILESRPIVVRHPATADGYVAGAAVERAALPLIREEHAKSDAVYHYFTRRPLEDPVFDMDSATNDATRMLQDRDRHDEKLPLFLLVGTGSTTESADGLGLLDLYDADSVVVDAAVADSEMRDTVDTLVSPELADVDGVLSTGALVASLAAAVNEDVRTDLQHLPATSYWEATPDAYVEAAADVGYDVERVAELREAIALEAYYQSYQDKRELVTDLLFDDGGDLAAHVSEQFREKLETEVKTAQANLETENVDGVAFAVLDTEAYTHKYDFPPTPLLLDELHRRNREGDYVTVGIGMDELFVRSTADLSVREIAETAADIAPEADIHTAGVREGKIEFLSGARDAVENAVIAAVAEQF